MTWMDAAACKGMDTNIFYPTEPAGIPAAKAICRTCPVSSDCFQWALDVRDEHAILGGVSAFTRLRILATTSRRPTTTNPTRGANNS